MPEFLYRFRPVDRLLGKNRDGGELEGTYVYFAPQKDLNDPLEGYRDVFWSGDLIVWRNLFRHYLFILTVRQIQLSTGTLSEDNFPIGASFHDQPPSLKELVNKALKIFTDSPCVSKHIELLAFQARKVSREELLCHFNVLHGFAMACVQKASHPDSPLKEELTLTIPKMFTEALENELEGLSSEGDTLEEGIRKILVTISTGVSLRFVYAQWRKGTFNEKLNIISFFPSDFVRNLEKLNFPDWYVACFMSECTDSSIWGTYGDNHRAVCLKFRTRGQPGERSIRLRYPSGIDSDGDVSWSMGDMNFRKITYGDSFESIDFFRMLGMLPPPTLFADWYTDEQGRRSVCADALKNEDEFRRDYWERWIKSTTVKLSDWDRENEFRVVSSSESLSDPANRKLEYEFNDLDGLIFGINTPPLHKLELIKAVRDLCLRDNRKEFNFYQARYDTVAKSIAIDLLPLNPLECAD